LKSHDPIFARVNCKKKIEIIEKGRVLEESIECEAEEEEKRRKEERNQSSRQLLKKGRKQELRRTLLVIITNLSVIVFNCSVFLNYVN
jgi:hypothetical protein